MHENCRIKATHRITHGFTLIELQISLAITALMAVVVCQVALMYSCLYDKTAARAQQSVMLLAALQQAHKCFDSSLMQQEGDFKYLQGVVLRNKKLIGTIDRHEMVLLEPVTHFTTQLDKRGDTVYGIQAIGEYQGRQIEWYRAAQRKVFSCSSCL